MNETPTSGTITQKLDADIKEIRRLDTLAVAMRRTWNAIREDMLDLGPLTRKQAAEQTCDYVYRDGHNDSAEAKRLGKEIQELSPKEFKELTLLAFRQSRYSA